MDITRAQLIEMIDWTTDCMGRISRVSGDTALRYVAREYEGGITAFIEEVCGEF